MGRRGLLPGLDLGDRGRPDPRPRQLREPSGCCGKKPVIWYVFSRFSTVPLAIRDIILTGAFSVEDNTFVMRADDWSIVDPAARGRNSVRISSQSAYGDSVIVLDLAHMPSGCATWPAFWTLSQKGPWPNGGEIDIIEGMLLVFRLCPSSSDACSLGVQVSISNSTIKPLCILPQGVKCLPILSASSLGRSLFCARAYFYKKNFPTELPSVPTATLPSTVMQDVVSPSPPVVLPTARRSI